MCLVGFVVRFFLVSIAYYLNNLMQRPASFAAENQMYLYVSMYATSTHAIVHTKQAHASTLCHAMAKCSNCRIYKNLIVESSTVLYLFYSLSTSGDTSASYLRVCIMQ